MKVGTNESIALHPLVFRGLLACKRAYKFFTETEKLCIWLATA